MLVEDRDTVMPLGLPSFSSAPQIDISPTLSKPQLNQLQGLLVEFADLFATDGLGRTSVVMQTCNPHRGTSYQATNEMTPSLLKGSGSASNFKNA